MNVTDVAVPASGWTPAVWVALGVGTVSVVVAIAAFINSVLARRHASTSAEAGKAAVAGAEIDRIVREKIREQEQASNVFAWRYYHAEYSTVEPDTIIQMWQIDVMHNVSPAPVFKVLVSAEAPKFEDAWTHVETPEPVLLPDGKPSVIAEVEMKTDYNLVKQVDLLYIVFSDGAGVRWSRDTRGVLEKVSASPAKPPRDL